MSARIRGHYRIDSHGRVESMLDVNGPALKFHAPTPAIANQFDSRLIKISVAGFVVMALMVGGMLALPQIQRSVINAEAARYASVRSTCSHLHGSAMHAKGDQFLRQGWPNQDKH